MTAVRTKTMVQAVRGAVRASELTPLDEAAVQLALVYAKEIDINPDPDVFAKLGPKLLATLAELGLTPRARADIAARGGVISRGTRAPTKADELRERRAKRDAAG